ncbi:L-fucose:H+ symporter permease [Planomicrobium sp. YIM 101495]|uniref:L-fucose:H+ symporter permease n=1 Tax=Planomicrobium sp. YIM 101495 TaxID=2665160 RepID=UPI0012B8E6B9|nr:L-fucose:H+ symporter permease [Planomicrobium sp. YIM 101495]MTD31960.1 L-fucose:H+ symporter permease [Planomicrobium sp. YIM 101495]
MSTIDTNTEPAEKRNPLNLIKMNSKQLKDGYLDKTPIFQFILLSLLFPLWGAAASLNDILITQFKHIFTLSDFATAFVQSAFYAGYFVVAIPASLIIKKTSYKIAILIGLICYIIGCTLFFPASAVATYSVFLMALFAIAVGLSFLETSANTYSSLLGPKKTSTLRLNISQTFYPLGSILGIVLGKYLVFGSGATLEEQMAGMTSAEQTIFAAEMLQKTLLPYKYLIMVLIVALIVFMITEFPKSKPAKAAIENAKISETLKYLASNKEFIKGIITQFFYVGMQTAVWSFTIRLAMQLNPAINERDASTFMIYSFIAFFLGKMIANFMMKRISPTKVLIGFSVLGSLATLYVTFVPNMSAVYMAIVVSGLFGPCWATIYSKTLDVVKDKRHTETAGAIIVMSIIGGAIIPLAQGLVSDLSGSLQFSFIVAFVCFMVVVIYAVGQLRHKNV